MLCEVGYYERIQILQTAHRAIILASMIMMALRISDIASGLDAISLRLLFRSLLGAVLLVLDILVVRYERWLWPM